MTVQEITLMSTAHNARTLGGVELESASDCLSAIGDGYLSYDFSRLLIYKGATARHLEDAGQWRRLDRETLGRYGPF